MLDRIASFASHRPRRVVAAAALLTALAFALGGSAGDRLYPYSAAGPASESSRATDRFLDIAGLDPDAGIVALVRPRAPVHTEVARRQVERIADRIFLDPSIAFVQTYWSTGNPAWVSRDGRETFIVGNFAV